MADLIEQAAATFGERRAFQTADGPVSFAEFSERVAQATPAVQSARLWMRAPESVQGLARMLAGVRAGATVALVGAREPEDRVRALEQQYGLEPMHEVSGKAGDPPSPGRLVIFTSGSTGPPKGVLHSLETLAASARGAAEALDFRPGDVWLHTLPMNHVGGLGPVFRALVSGGTMDFSEAPLHQALDRVSHVSLVATQLRRLLDARPLAPASLKCVLLGGSAIPEELAARALDGGWPIALSYGMSEMGSLVTATTPGSVGSSGFVLPERRLQVDPTGEILVGGPSLFLGYLDGDAPGKWHATGDLGTLDAEGQLHVTGRKDDMFISGGENIHPAAIERALQGCPGVLEVRVIPVRDSEFGERPLAFVRGDASPETLREWARRKMPGYMVPVRFLPLPQPDQGIKHTRSELQRLAVGALG